jgi:hypothetical protein
MCILLHFFICVGAGKILTALESISTKSFPVIHLSGNVIRITNFACFGAGNASLLCNKEAANSSMTTLFDSPCHFPNCHSWRNGMLHRLS